MKTPEHPDDPHWESEMGDELERRVRDLHEATLDLGSVKDRARTIRTKRRAAVAGGLLAAAAVIVPVAVLATSPDADRGTVIDPAQTPSQEPTPEPSPTITDPVPPEPPEPSELPAPGPALGFAYLEQLDEASVLHTADGSVVELPARYDDAAVLAGPIVGYRADDQGNGFVDVIDGGSPLTVSTTYAVRSAMSTTPDGRTVAFVTVDDELIFYTGGIGEQSFGEVDPAVTLGAAIGNGDCVLETGCHPFLEYSDFSEGDAFEINYEGPQTAPAPGALRVNDAADGFLVSVITQVTDDSTCGGLYDREGGGRWVFETCDHQVHAISPSGAHTIGFDTYVDGLGPRSFYLLDTEGAVVASRTVDGVVADIAWIDDTHAAATVYDGGSWSIISFGLDGTEEVLVEGAAGDELSPPYRITGQN